MKELDPWKIILMTVPEIVEVVDQKLMKTLEDMKFLH
jgi:hypothetical protein